MRHRTNCRGRTTNSSVTVTVTVITQNCIKTNLDRTMKHGWTIQWQQSSKILTGWWNEIGYYVWLKVLITRTDKLRNDTIIVELRGRNYRNGNTDGAILFIC